MLNPFTKYWLTASCAPDSIINIKTDIHKNNYLDVIRNEDKTIIVNILSNDANIIAIGTDYDELLASPSFSFKEGVSKIADILNLTHISI